MTNEYVLAYRSDPHLRWAFDTYFTWVGLLTKEEKCRIIISCFGELPRSLRSLTHNEPTLRRERIQRVSEILNGIANAHVLDVKHIGI